MPGASRKYFGLDGHRPTLLVHGGRTYSLPSAKDGINLKPCLLGLGCLKRLLVADETNKSNQSLLGLFVQTQCP